jgi:hypothetical protein
MREVIWSRMSERLLIPVRSRQSEEVAGRLMSNSPPPVADPIGGSHVGSSKKTSESSWSDEAAEGIPCRELSSRKGRVWMSVDAG